MAMIALSKLVDKLQQHNGTSCAAALKRPTGANHLGEHCVSGESQASCEAFAILKRTIGTCPEQILAAEHSALAGIGTAGILPDVSAEKLLADCQTCV